MAKKTMQGVTAAAGLVGGAVAGNFVTKKASEMLPVVGTYGGAIPIVLGWLLAGMKQPVAKAVGAGMIAAGGANLIAHFVPATAAPVSDSVLADSVLAEDLTEELSAAPEDSYIHDDMSEDLTEELSEELSGEDY